MAARQIGFKNQRPRAYASKTAVPNATETINTDKSNVKSKIKIVGSSQQPTLTGFLKESHPTGASKQTHSNSLQDLREFSLEKEVDTDIDLEAPVVNEGTTWADEADNISMGPNNGEDLAGTSVTDCQGHSDSSGKTWAQIVAVDREKFLLKDINSNNTSVNTVSNTAAGASRESLIQVGPSEAVQHKVEVPPVLVAYCKVAIEGECISLMQIATAVLQVMGDQSVLDAVQPMKQGWYIYMQTLADHATLVERGLTVAGKFVPLRSELRHDAIHLVKVTLKDLPLHSIGNEEVLEAMKEVCSVTFAVNYSNLWFDGKITNIQNGDCFLYVDVKDVPKLPSTLQVGTSKQARVFKPVGMLTCKHCGNVGHRLVDDACPAKAMEDIQQSIETFQGGRCKLSNLHQCPHGCEIDNLGTKFPMSEHHYQFKKLKAHDLGVEAYELLLEEDSFKAMKKGKALIPDSATSEEWKQVACKEMMSSNKLKYVVACSHAQE